MYDNGAVYTIEIKSDATGSWTIGKGTSKATTYVTHYDLANPTAYSNELSKNSKADFTHTVVWFAVKWKVQAMPDTVVIDYGLPVDIDVLSNDMFGANGKLAGVGTVENLPAGYDSATEGGAELSGNFSTELSSTYGTAKADVSTGNVRYTPANMQMNGYDKFAYAVNYTGSSNSGYYYDTVTVIPATTVYYEDNFVDYSSYTWKTGWVKSESSLWSDSGNASGATQTEDRPGKFSLSDANNIYGYDAANLNMTTYSQGSAKVATVDYDNYAEAEFTFYGTGFDIISMTSNTTGTILVDVVRVDGSVAPKKLIVDTYYGYMQDANGQWIVDPEANDALYQIPVMKVVDLPYGQYKVTVKATYDPAFDHVAPSYDTGSYEFYLDAIRIYDPANDGAVDNDNVIENAYAADGEGWPSYFELRNKIIAANSFDKVANDALSTDIEGLVFIDGDAKVGNLQISDYVSYGPNNEVYLASGQSVAFKLANVSNKVANVHIGIKSANGIAGNYTIKNIAAADILDDDGNKQVDAGTEYNAKPYTVETSTDMYYDLGTWKNDIIVITNTSSEDSGAIVSLTNIKATYTENPGNGAVLASEDPVEETTNLVYAYMTPAAATLTLRSLNAPAVEEEEVPETNVPETTVPEVTEPEVEETTEPETQETKPSKPTKPGKEDKETKPTKPGKEDKGTKPTEPANNNKPAMNNRTEEVRNNLNKVASTIRNVVTALLSRWF